MDGGRAGEDGAGAVDTFPFCDRMGVRGGLGIVPTYVCVSAGTGGSDLGEETLCGLTT